MLRSLAELASGRSRWRLTRAWLLSMAAHLAVGVAAALLLAPGKSPERLPAVRQAKVVLVDRKASRQPAYFMEETATGAKGEQVAAAASARPQPGTSLVDGREPPGAGLPELPSDLPVPFALPAGGPLEEIRRSRPKLPPATDEAAVLAADRLLPREQVPSGPKAQLTIFGAKSEGRSFVFTIDRSKSMGGTGLGAIEAAASELAAQVTALSAEQQVQAIAYNESIVYCSGRTLVASDEAHKARLVGFVKSLSAFGQTEHEQGLLAALRLRPEVIYLLTDGGDPHLTPGQSRRIREQCAGKTSINVVHFGRGSGERAASDHFLCRLAAENGGTYAYVDVTQR